mmetsp:Transcript_13819/g.34810  ORF Transcript_13819/g.34810 Transcript_13819/m.34810 type:complete len:318 (+) Transcript_13819:2601-3554(+)
MIVLLSDELPQLFLLLSHFLLLYRDLSLPLSLCIAHVPLLEVSLAKGPDMGCNAPRKRRNSPALDPVAAFQNTHNPAFAVLVCNLNQFFSYPRVVGFEEADVARVHVVLGMCVEAGTDEYDVWVVPRDSGENLVPPGAVPQTALRPGATNADVNYPRAVESGARSTFVLELVLVVYKVLPTSAVAICIQMPGLPRVYGCTSARVEDVARPWQGFTIALARGEQDRILVAHIHPGLKHMGLHETFELESARTVSSSNGHPLLKLYGDHAADTRFRTIPMVHVEVNYRHPFDLLAVHIHRVGCCYCDVVEQAKAMGLRP